MSSHYSCANTLPDIDSVWAEIYPRDFWYFRKELDRDNSELSRLMIAAFHLTLEDFFETSPKNASIGKFSVFIENNPIYVNTARRTLAAYYESVRTRYDIRTVYGSYSKNMRDYFKEPRFTASFSSRLSSNNLSLTISLENFKVQDKYTAILTGIADYIYRFEYSCDSAKWVLSDIEKVLYTTPNIRILHPIGYKVR